MIFFIMKGFLFILRFPKKERGLAMRRNRIVMFSGGLSSFLTAYHAVTTYPTDNIVLYFNDVLIECDSLYRFIYEVSDKLELPLLIHSRGITPAQLMVQKRFLANNRVGLCSKELKMKVSSDFIRKGIVPEIEKWHNKQFLKDDNFRDNPIISFGIGVGELHREEPIKSNWQPYQTEFPLIYEDIESAEKVLERLNVPIPLMYRQSFSHNNCGGMCVKGGAGHFKNLLMKREEDFHKFKEQEIVISDYIRYCRQSSIKSGKQKDYLYNDVWDFVTTGKKSAKIQHIIDTNKYRKNWNFGNRKGQYTFMKGMSLEELEQQPIQCDIWDFTGGCGCFTDYDSFSEVEENEQSLMVI